MKSILVSLFFLLISVLNIISSFLTEDKILKEFYSIKTLISFSIAILIYIIYKDKK